MQNQQGTSGSNGNGENGKGVFDGMTLKEAVKILLQEIGDVRLELLGRMGALEERMGKLEERMNKLETEFQSLRIEIHRHQITFMKNHDDLERRVAVLETKK